MTETLTSITIAGHSSHLDVHKRFHIEVEIWMPSGLDIAFLFWSAKVKSPYIPVDRTSSYVGFGSEHKIKCKKNMFASVSDAIALCRGHLQSPHTKCTLEARWLM